MLVSSEPQIELTYCLNVLPAADDSSGLLAILDEYFLPAAAEIARGEPVGLGLWIPDDLARKLEKEEETTYLAAGLHERGLYVFTLNGFPMGRFHGGNVKYSVYSPDWRSDERVEYTLRLARILVGLLPEGGQASISTLPGTLRRNACCAEHVRAVADGYAQAAWELERIAESSGREIVLAVEPEPGCMLESCEQTAAFFENLLFSQAARRLALRYGMRREAGEDILRRRVGVCLDTCHAAVVFEDPLECIRLLTGKGIAIAKIQLSAGLEVDVHAGWRERLAPFAEDTYLHQVRYLRGEERRAWDDLPDVLRDAREPAEGGTMRVHYHVPLGWSPSASEGVGSTLPGSMGPRFWEELRRGVSRHLEVETYTFAVLPEHLRNLPLQRHIADELEWVWGRLRDG